MWGTVHILNCFLLYFFGGINYDSKYPPGAILWKIAAHTTVTQIPQKYCVNCSEILQLGKGAPLEEG